MAKAKLEIVLTEKQIIHAWIDKATPIVEDDNFFITATAEEYKLVLLSLKVKSLDFIPEHILKEKIMYIDSDSIQSILDTQYQADKIDVYYEDLKRYKIFYSLENQVYPLFKPGNIKDVSLLEEAKEKLDSALDQLQIVNKSPYMNFYDALEENQPFLEELHKSGKHTTGDIYLDKLLGNQGIVPSINVISGYTGSYKSTFIHHLFITRLAKLLPTGLINTELAFPALMNCLTPVLMKMGYDEVTCNSMDKDNEIDSHAVLAKYDHIKFKYFENNNAFIYPKNHASIQDIKDFIIFARKRMELPKEQLFFCLVDLLSMIDDFAEEKSGMNHSDSIEVKLNKLNDVCLETNTFLLGSLQLKRNDNYKINTEEDIDKFRGSVNSIKSSSEWAGRSRNALILHCANSICRGASYCDPVIMELHKDAIIEVTLGKSSFSKNQASSIKYVLDPFYKKLWPYLEEEEDGIPSGSI